MNYLEIAKKYQKELINSIQEIIKIPSFNDPNTTDLENPFGKSIKEALDYYLNLGKENSFTIKNIDNYAGYIELGKKEDELFGILVHLDVVPATGNWKYDPFSGVIENNRIYGRGAIDDKGPAIIAFYALKIIKDLNIKLNKRVRIIAGCDEELNMRCLKHYLSINEEVPSLGFTPDADFPAIYGEKGICSTMIKGNDISDIIKFYSGERFNLVPDYASVELKINLDKEFENYLKTNNLKGEISGKNTYIIYGISSHAMQPQKGINAAFLLSDFLKNYVRSDFLEFIDKYLSYDYYGEKMNLKCYNDDLKELTENPGIFRLENNKFEIGINYRVPDNSCFDKIIDETKKIIKNYNFEVEMLDKSNVHLVDKDSLLVKSLYEAYSKYTNDFTNKPFTIGGGTYARCFKNNVAFGPTFIGDEDVVHQVNEYIDIDKAVLTLAIYIEAIIKLCA